MNEDLEHLAARAAAGDEGVVPELLQAIRPQVLHRVSKFLPVREDAEEAAQDTLLQVATKIHTFKGTGSFAGWLTVVATNCARQTYRSLKRRSVEQSAEVLPESVDPRTTSVIAGSRLDLLEALEALESNHPQLVQPLVLRDLGAMTYVEIADELAVPLGTVKARIHQARKEVAEHLTVR
ncbi:RNA polymerase sigma-70 factor (ECF subfamily) [Kribbella orskensis]|uniref:RNA polymerase sigma-70 factor (ECF subfamily) n=1 Tax=Kribbella orskensis TaxID=2512216 RepID=A0ABY2BXQ4_9ACTN|nr:MULTISPECIES: RNA polymerase sigma factor [Kribbella]TCN44083.1 RNA polymerase sigma-70 factor (ECF subfamily) [Kribbella sp. VKM Ac-2500]TCO32139.1 RNA polymerase sigma-70 factor (ECF subfamily) [Kribbella orskensis]